MLMTMTTSSLTRWGGMVTAARRPCPQIVLVVALALVMTGQAVGTLWARPQWLQLTPTLQQQRDSRPPAPGACHRRPTAALATTVMVTIEDRDSDETEATLPTTTEVEAEAVAASAEGLVMVVTGAVTATPAQPLTVIVTLMIDGEEGGDLRHHLIGPSGIVMTGQGDHAGMSRGIRPTLGVLLGGSHAAAHLHHPRTTLDGRESGREVLTPAALRVTGIVTVGVRLAASERGIFGDEALTITPTPHMHAFMHPGRQDRHSPRTNVAQSGR